MDFGTTSKEIVSRFFGVNPGTVSVWLAEGCPGSPGRYPLDEILQWVKHNRWCQSSDPLLAGGDSANLERYRGVKADLAELDLQERRGMLVDQDTVKPVFLQSLGFISSAIEQLDRQYGNDAFAIALAGWDQIERHISEMPDDEESTENVSKNRKDS